MKWMEQLNENIKRTLRSWLNVLPANPYNFQINEMLDFEGHAIRNRIWYRGDGNELEQFYQQNREYADKYKFWASKSSPGLEMRKIHTGLPGQRFSAQNRKCTERGSIHRRWSVQGDG